MDLILVKSTGINLAGWPDLMVFLKGGKTVFIEMKTKRGKLGERQAYWLNELKDLGFTTAVCRSAEEAMEVINNELGND